MTSALVPAEPLARTLAALSPTDVPAAQASLVAWCNQKIRLLGRELREQRTNLRIAKASKWKYTGWAAQVNHTKRRMIYYTKLRAAVEAGYLIVPNFDIDVIAVRVKRETAPAVTDTHNSPRVTKAQPELLPPGQGRYVDDEVFRENNTYEAPDPTNPGRSITKGEWRVTGFDDEIDWPVRLVKSVILDATRIAMARRIFDQIGIVKARKQDPIVIGQIIKPGGNGTFWKQTVSFFIAWWLDPETL